MDVVAVGDRVQVLCASSLGDGTELDNKSERTMPYWIRAHAGDCDAEPERANEVIVGMRVGERRALMIGRAATPQQEACTVIHLLEVVAIRKAAEASARDL